MPAKGQIIVFGLTERDGGPVHVRDQELHDYLVRKEAYLMEQEALKEPGGLRQHQELRRQRPENRREQHGAANGAETFVTEGDFTRVIVWDDDDEGEDEAIEDVETPQTQSQTQPVTEPTVQFRFDREMERRERALFGPKDRSQRHRCVFVIVPDRSAQTLLPIVKKYVKPQTYVFSDQWAAYHTLGGTFKHFTVTHKRRFVKYLFFEDMLVLKVTTNHIERLWVELRRILKGVTVDEFPDKLALVPYRLMVITPGQHTENMIKFLGDLVTAATLLALRDRGSAFRLSNN